MGVANFDRPTQYSIHRPIITPLIRPVKLNVGAVGSHPYHIHAHIHTIGYDNRSKLILVRETGFARAGGLGIFPPAGCPFCNPVARDDDRCDIPHRDDRDDRCDIPHRGPLVYQCGDAAMRRCNTMLHCSAMLHCNTVAARDERPCINHATTAAGSLRNRNVKLVDMANGMGYGAGHGAMSPRIGGSNGNISG